MRRTISIIARVFLISSVIVHKSFVCAQDNKQDNAHAAPSGLNRLFSEYKKCCRCHLEKWKAGTQPLENAASYTRHRSPLSKTSRCRTYVGNSMSEHDANSCPDHTNTQVQRLLELCRSAVTYHLPTGEIDTVEADPIAGKRDRMPAGPYAGRVTKKPVVEQAQLCKDAQQKLRYVRLLDSNNRVLMVFEYTKPLKQIETETGVVYLIDQHMLNKAELYVDINNVTTAVEVEPQQRLF